PDQHSEVLRREQRAVDPVSDHDLSVRNRLPGLVVGLDSFEADVRDAASDLGFEVGGHEISLIALIAAVVVLVLAFQVGRWSRQKLRDGLLPGFTEDAGLRNSIASLGYYAVLVLGVLLAIGVAGFDLTNLAIVAGALSVGIGFGLQNVVNNFVSGLILLFERPVRVGDVIDYQGTWATVEEIKVRSTHIRTFDQADLIVPNSELVSSTVTNWSHSGEQARVIVDVQVAYGSDTRRVHDLLHQVATEHPQVDAEPAPTVLFRDFGDSALIFQLRCFTHLDNYLGVPSDLRFRIDELFRENGITIPFPQRDVHLHSADPVPASG
ncbi:MAG: mechanosensitive ion channel family protein, partial [Thiohalospira sp.]